MTGRDGCAGRGGFRGRAQERGRVLGGLDDVFDAHSGPFRDEIGEGHHQGLLFGGSLVLTGKTGCAVASNHIIALDWKLVRSLSLSESL